MTCSHSPTAENESPDLVTLYVPSRLRSWESIQLNSHPFRCPIPGCVGYLPVFRTLEQLIEFHCEEVEHLTLLIDPKLIEEW